MPETSLKTAIVGCGLFGDIHAIAYSQFERSELVTVCDIDGDRARAMGQKYGVRWCTSVEEIAADPDVQAVSVATPDFAHRQVCLQLAEAGKHLLIEKPLATSVEDAQAIADAVDRSGVVGMVDFHNRYHPALRTIQEPLERGEIGRGQMMYARLSDRIEVATQWFNWSGQSGPQWFLGSHLADMACWILGQMPTRVYAEGRKDVLAGRGIDCYDSMQIHLSFPDAFATLETSWILPNTFPMICDFYVSLQTTTTRADADLSHQGATLVSPDRFEKGLLFGQTPVGKDSFGYFVFPVREFVRAVLSGSPSPVPVCEGVKNVKIIAAAVESARTHQPVELAL